MNDQWISVADKMPEPGRPVKVIHIEIMYVAHVSGETSIHTVLSTGDSTFGDFFRFLEKEYPNSSTKIGQIKIRQIAEGTK